MKRDEEIEMSGSSLGQSKPGSYSRVAAVTLMLICLAGLVACIPSQVEKTRSEAFKQYETIVRWSQWDAAVNFIAPDYLEEHPVSRLEMDRLRLFRVTQYTIRSTDIYDEGMGARQTVEIKMFNAAQATERTIMDDQEWRYDPIAKRWLLHSGLPDPTRRY